MDAITFQRLFGAGDAFNHPVTVAITAIIFAGLVIAFAVIKVLGATRRISPELHIELTKRTVAWAVMAPLLVGPVLLGAAWTMGAVALLSLACFREFARATGFFRHRALSATVGLGILAVTFAIADHWYNFFFALTPLTVIIVAAVAILQDEPKGYIQRVALGVFAFLFFGTCLGHLGYMANDVAFRPIVLMILLTVELNDVFAYISGKLTGRRKLAPNTSPNKTIGGALGALLATTALTAVLAHFVFQGEEWVTPLKLIALGMIVSIAGQLGDLMLSSIKRDLGIKDMGATIPGHGGLLDRFDSLLLVAPAVFHYVGYFRGFGLDQPVRIFSGS
ncbi:MAG TPA: phosphatidate cytidylyltransferase [Chthoniobacteraceae bacterium]|jgi:phosphatidate cytidylyltransferase